MLLIARDRHTSNFHRPVSTPVRTCTDRTIPKPSHPPTVIGIRIMFNSGVSHRIRIKNLMNSIHLKHTFSRRFTT